MCFLIISFDILLYSFAIEFRVAWCVRTTRLIYGVSLTSPTRREGEERSMRREWILVFLLLWVYIYVLRVCFSFYSLWRFFFSKITYDSSSIVLEKIVAPSAGYYSVVIDMYDAKTGL
jgi:hypothetical protein